MTLHEHNAMLWLTPAQMPELDWAAADRPIISEYLRRPASPLTQASL